MDITGLPYSMRTCAQRIMAKRFMAARLCSTHRRDQKTGGSAVTGVVFYMKHSWRVKMQVAVSIVPGKWKYNIKSVVIMKKKYARMLT